MNVPNRLKPFLENALLTALNGLGEGVFLTDGRHVLFANESFCKLTGYSEDELSHLSSLEDLFPESQSALWSHGSHRSSHKPMTPLKWSPCLKQKNQVLRAVEISLSPLGEGHEIQWLGLARDLVAVDTIQLKKAQDDLRASRERLQAVVTAAPLVIFALDENGNFTLSEGSGLKALNLKPGQVVGRSALEFYREYPELIRDLRRALKGEKFVATVQVAGLWFETQYVPLADEKGKLTGVSGIAVDVTDRKRMEESLRQRMEFEKLITNLSSQFINLPWEKIDQGIKKSLDSIGRFIGADRALLFLAKGDKLDRPAFEWAASAAVAGEAWNPETFLSDYTWFSEQIRHQEVLHVESPDELPPQAAAERRFLMARKVTSLVVIPIVSGGLPMGLLSFSTTLTPKRWSPEDIALFKITGEMLSSALERKHAELALRGSEDKFRELFNNANDAIFIFSLFNDGVPGKFVEVNDLACQKTRFSREELLQMTPYDLTAPEDTSDMPKLFKRLLDQGHVTYEKAHLSKEGHKVPFEVNSHVFTWNGQKMAQAIARDVSDRKRAEETIRRQAFYDVLTGLPNRTLFKDRLEQAMKTAQRNKQVLCVMVLDLDRFKTINETLGHQIGDKLLMGVADRLLGILADNGTIARFGGDEFTLLWPQVNQAEEATRHAQRIIETLTAAFKLDGHELHVTTSIGMAFFPEDGENPEVLMKNAETAMYRAKEQGRNNFQLYASVMNVSAFKQLLMENSLRRALEKEEFVVYLQPQIDLATRRMIGAEALVRWQHPDLGLVFPTEFIGLAEETGLIVPIGEWVLERVCKLGKQWREKGLPNVCVSVNLSARQFQQRDLVSRIAQILQETGLDPDYLGLEITESIAMKNADFTISALNDMKKMGIHLSLDDFGTGYSSLSYLKRFPLETLKIDRSFVRDITTDPNDAAIVQAVIALAHSLKLKVVAEGVETEGQLGFLKSHGCDQVQGYYYSHPLSEENFLDILREFPQAGGFKSPLPPGRPSL